MAVALDRLCKPWRELQLEGRRQVPIETVEIDSRACGPGALFVAVSGSQSDGHAYVPAAVAAGCAAVVVASDQRSGLALDPEAERPPAVVTAARTLGMPARLARELAGRPDSNLVAAGVTGTNGKTTVTFLLRAMFDALIGTCGLIGTVRYEIGSRKRPAFLTTPDGPTLFGLLRDMVADGCRSVALEISSHALDQERTADLALDVAILTNLGRDHLDYHRDRREYLRAKGKILDLVSAFPTRDKPIGTVVVNAADPAFVGLDYGDLRLFRFAAAEPAVADLPVDLRVTDRELRITGTRLILAYAGEQIELNSPLVGSFNVENLTAALAAGLALGLPARSCAEALARVEQVPGRLERFVLPGGGLAVVDYAHTPDALAAVLAACRELTTGQLLVVFGCGGDRDRGKRPLMGEVAAQVADRVWITSDNPRSEDPVAICQAVFAGFDAATERRAETAATIVDRTLAIEGALAAAAAGDIVVVAGKGHEDYQLVGNQRLELDDRQIIRQWITRRSVDV